MAKSTTASRERARKVYATRMAEQRRIEALNEEDLAAYFAEADVVADAERSRASARTVAERAYKKALADADDAFERASQRAAERQAAALRQLRDRGETITALAELTGATATEVRKMIGTGKPRAVAAVADDSTKQHDAASDQAGGTSVGEATTPTGDAKEKAVAAAS